MGRRIRSAAAAALVLAAALTAGAQAVQTAKIRRARVKDIASVEGVRDNQLVGYGIVVGLHGTGDSSQTVFPLQTLESALERMGVNLQGNAMASMMQTRNMAAVFMSGTLPPFAQPGNKVDVTVSSAGDARSLEGGVLLLAPLYGPDGQIYAEAQGPMVLGGYAVTANGSSKSVNYPTTARIPSGAIVERGVPLDLARLHTLSLLLDDDDFHTAEMVAGAIDQAMGRKLAHAVDSRRIQLEPAANEDITALLARVEEVEVEVDPRAKVVVNERTGTVVIGGNVTLQPVTILHGGLVVNVVSRFEVSQPNALGQGTTQVVQQTTVQAQDKAASRIELKEGATVDDLVENLQAIGATARDIVSILQAMKEAGALEAELEVL
ncbi:MAG TPA: flagellar basal body P-ring protein FlgI [Acidobacteriaceae bacterium]|jgi:flagellar P-ring protein precursor FlgI